MFKSWCAIKKMKIRKYRPPSFTLAIPLETLYIHAHEKNLEPSTST